MKNCGNHLSILSANAVATRSSCFAAFMLALTSGITTANDFDISSRDELTVALAKAEPGDRLIIAPGEYRGDIRVSQSSGTAEKPISIVGQLPDDPPVFRAGNTGFHLSNCQHLILKNLVIRGAKANGMNIDDGGTAESPSQHIVLENIVVEKTGPKGNRDGIKLSGVDHFTIRKCSVLGWGGSGIDMVGCHHGLIELCKFEGLDGFSQSNGLQMKGGSSDILVKQNTFRDTGQRGINIGGSTGLDYFRPDVEDYEATRIEVAGNQFYGSLAPIAWVTAQGGWVHHNTFQFSDKWVLRILQENKGEQFKPSSSGRFENNVVICDQRVRVAVNIGGGTAPETFTFKNNFWLTPSNQRPSLPTEDIGGEFASPETGRNIESHLVEQAKKGRGALAYKSPSKVSRHRWELSIPPPQDSAGGIIVADVNNDAKMDFLVTVPGHLTVIDNSGRELWTKKIDIGVGGQSESQGLPGHDGPGVAAGDIDGDGKTEIVFLTRSDSTIHVVDGLTGKEKATARPPVPEGAIRWELAMIADFRGSGGDADILLQATNASGYRTGRYLAAYQVSELFKGGAPIWTTSAFKSCAHNGARLADLDGDGRDEVLGEIILKPDGTLLARPAKFRGHMDSVFAYDLRTDLPGIEVVLLEEGSNHVQLLGKEGVIWRKANLGAEGRGREPQNAAIGRFQKGNDAMFIWCRSRNSKHQTPFVFDAQGELSHHYEMDAVKPDGWTDSGVEVIHTIDWTGEPTQLACAKERHTNGHVGIFEPLSGKFVEPFKVKADRLYVADVYGDWREEVIVLEGNQLIVFENQAENPRPNQPRLWQDRNYRRLKHCHNYYSP